ncbi:unnamed protein product, partial [Prorocentrum cordatum]
MFNRDGTDRDIADRRALIAALPRERAEEIGENDLVYLDPPQTGPNGQKLTDVQQIHNILAMQAHIRNACDNEDFILHATIEYGNVTECSRALPLLSYLADVLVTRGARDMHPRSGNLIFSANILRMTAQTRV